MDPYLKYRKREKASVLLILLIAAFLLDPFKVTDPNDPRFNPYDFEFSDADDITEMITTIRTMFPEGTDKIYLEEILVKKAGAQVFQKNDQDKYNEFNYIKKPFTIWSFLYPRVWNIAVDYDEHDKVEQLYVNGSKLFK